MPGKIEQRLRDIVIQLNCLRLARQERRPCWLEGNIYIHKVLMGKKESKPHCYNAGFCLVGRGGEREGWVSTQKAKDRTPSIPNEG